MTQQSRRGLIALTLFVIVVGCSNDTTHPELQGNTIYGSWRWIMSSGGFAGQIFTPESVHQEQKLVFGRDQREQRYIDGSLVYSCHFSLHKSVWGQDSIDVLHCSDVYKRGSDKGSIKELHYEDELIERSIYLAHTDTLILRDLGSDGMVDTYTRIK